MATSNHPHTRKKSKVWAEIFFRILLLFIFAVYPLLRYSSCANDVVRPYHNFALTMDCTILLTAHMIGMLLGMGRRLYSTIKMVRSDQKFKSPKRNVLTQDPTIWFKVIFLFLGTLILLTIIAKVTLSLFPTTTIFILKLVPGFIGGLFLMDSIVRILHAIKVIDVYESYDP